MYLKILADKRPKDCEYCIFYEERLEQPKDIHATVVCEIVKGCFFSQSDLEFTIDNCPIIKDPGIFKDVEDTNDIIFNIPDEIPEDYIISDDTPEDYID